MQVGRDADGGSAPQPVAREHIPFWDRRSRALLAAIAVLATLPFLHAVTGKFVYDDHALIEERGAIHALDLVALWRSEFWEGTRSIHLHYLRPLVSTSYALDWALWQKRPFGFHLTNLALHALVSVLVSVNVKRWTRGAWPYVFLVTLLWAWHPSKVEAVAWISGRTDLLCALGLMTMCLGTARRLSRARWSGLLLELAGLFLALASKEHAVVAPAFAALEGLTLCDAQGDWRKSIRSMWTAALPQTIVVVVYLALRTIFYPIVPSGAGGFSFLDARLFTLETIGEFARVTFCPYPLSILRAAIRTDPAGHLLHSPLRLEMGAAFLLLFTALLVRRTGRPLLRAGLGLGAIALVPVANVISSKMIFLFAERFAYLPLIGFAAALVPRKGDDLGRIEKTTLGLAAIASLSLSALHTCDFLSEQRFWEHELAVDGSQPLALRWASEEALKARRPRDALALSLRGYRSLEGWPLPQPYGVEFALRAVRTLELLTLDHDRATLQRISDFYRTFLAGTGVARIEIDGTPLAVDAAAAEARRFRADPERSRKTDLWAGIAASRTGECDRAAALVARYRNVADDWGGRVSAVLALSRCHRWNEAIDAAHALDQRLPAVRELVANLTWAKDASEQSSVGIEAAMQRSHAATLAGDRAGAYEELSPYRTEIASDHQATLFFARAAWAAGEDAGAREALMRVVDETEATRLLTAWSKEIGRDPP